MSKSMSRFPERNVSLSRAKTWTADHIRLAVAAEMVRTELRRLAAEIGGNAGSQLFQLASAITTALKARGSCERDGRDGAAENRYDAMFMTLQRTVDGSQLRRLRL